MDDKIKRLLFLELDDDGRPFNVMVDKGGCCEDYNFEYSKHFKRNFCYHTGGGPISGTTVYQSLRGNEPVKVRFWAADDFPVTVEAELYERLTEQPYTLEQLFGDEECPNGEEFEDCGDMEYCSVCDDWYPDYEYECGHLKWDDWWGVWTGTGATEEIKPKDLKPGVFAVLKLMGRSRVKFLRKMLLSHDYRLYWSCNDLFMSQEHSDGDGRQKRHYARAFRDIEIRENKHLARGFNWLETLDAGKTDEFDLITAGWISEWLANKPSVFRPLPEGFTTGRTNRYSEECVLKYLRYPVGTYESIEDVWETIHKVEAKACELHPDLDLQAAVYRYMNDLVNAWEHRDVAV